MASWSPAADRRVMDAWHVHRRCVAESQNTNDFPAPALANGFVAFIRSAQAISRNMPRRATGTQIEQGSNGPKGYKSMHS
ncbi:hypothetical protein PsYK624_024460 [Phanerochaete sordida]|uniref:Uncharacterized protein n=1 Tax=Phanerochaete sordida TaxID=48140 RepID=A0A9P3L8Q8_9APHY|nr:hypothetical protein PsYK624_024460 [Phanerochaete sordida]